MQPTADVPYPFRRLAWAMLVTAAAIGATVGTNVALLVASPGPQARVQAAREGTARESAVQGDAAPGDSALQDFQRRLKAYLDLRESLTKKLAPLKSTDDTGELVARQDSLAAAIREARKQARPGDLMVPAIAERLRAAVAADFKARSPEDRRAVYAEVPQGIRLVVNHTFPAKAALPTVPPLLLNAMPALPDNLQYRFVGRNLILLDGDTQIIADYITNVLPPK